MINNKDQIIDVTPEEFELLTSYYDSNKNISHQSTSQNQNQIIDVSPEEFERLMDEYNPQSMPQENPEQIESNQENNLIQKFTGMSPEQQQKLVGDILNLAVKAPASSIGSIVDLFATPVVNAGVSAYNAVAPEEYQAPYAQSAEKTIEQGVNYLGDKAGLNLNQPTAGYEGAKLASSVAIPGGLASKAGTFTNLAKTIGTTNPKALAGAIGAGEAANYAKEQGSGALGQLGSGVAGAVGGEILASAANPKNIAKGVTKLAAKGIGLGKNNIKTEALDAAERLGLEGLPAAAATDSIITAYASQLISKIPKFGDKLRADVKNTSKEFQSAWDKMLDSIAPEIDQELSKEAQLIYKSPNNLIGKEDVVSPNLILNKINETRSKLTGHLDAEATKKLKSYLDELEKSFIPEKKQLSSLKGFDEKNLSDLPEATRNQILEKANEIISQKDIYVKDLLRTKIELNKIMRDRNIFDRTDRDNLSFLKGIQQSIKDTLEVYGKTNPKWYESFQKAENKFAGLAKRESLEDVLSGKITDVETGDVKYTPLIKVLEDRKQQKFLKNNLGDTNYKKLEDFVKVAQSMSSINRNVLNPSSSAIVGTVILAIQSLAFQANPFPLLAATTGAHAITKLLTDKKFLNKVNQFAKEPTEPLAQKIDSIIKDHMGIGSQALMKQINQQDYGMENEK